MRSIGWFAASISCAVGSATGTDYIEDVLPIMKEQCWKCHSNEHDVKGNVALDDFDEMRDYQIGKYNIIRPGNPEESNFLERLLLDPGHTDFMPRRDDPLSDREIEVIEEWIRMGAVIDASNPSEEEQAWVARITSDVGSEEPDFETWTSSEGKAIEARFHSMTTDSVKIIMRDGRVFDVPFTRLSPESVELAKQRSGSE